MFVMTRNPRAHTGILLLVMLVAPSSTSVRGVGHPRPIRSAELSDATISYSPFPVLSALGPQYVTGLNRRIGEIANLPADGLRIDPGVLMADDTVTREFQPEAPPIVSPPAADKALQFSIAGPPRGEDRKLSRPRGPMRFSRGTIFANGSWGNGVAGTVDLDYQPPALKAYLTPERIILALGRIAHKYQNFVAPSKHLTNQSLYLYSRSNTSGTITSIEFAYTLNQSFLIAGDVQQLSSPYEADDSRFDAFDRFHADRSIAYKYSEGLLLIYKLENYRALVSQIRYSPLNGSILGIFCIQQVF